MRLIDADEPLKYIEENNTEREWVVNKYNADWIWSFIDSAPTIDAEPVRHGHWIEDDDGDGRHCSICGEDYCYLISNCELYNYCPNCGAKMDEEDTE